MSRFAALEPVLAATARSVARFRGALSAVLWMILALLVASAQRGQGADGPLLGTAGALAIPLLAFALASAVLYGRNTKSAVEPLMMLGASRANALAAVFAIPVLGSMVLSAIVGALVVAIAHVPGAPASDAFTTLWICGLGGAAYASVFVGASSFGKNGGGRSAALIVDFVFGASDALGGAITPRGHLRNLLGGEAPLEITQRASSIALVLFVVLGVAVAALRLRPRVARVTRPLSDRAARA